MSKQLTLWDTLSATSSPASEGGALPCGLLAGPTTDPCGPALAPVSRSRRPARAKATPTPATSGPSSADSSPSAILQRSLESRLQALLAGLGSPLYDLTWKQWAMPSGPPICAQRASARRISDSGCTGWPTAIGAAQMAGWPTATARDWKDGHEQPKVATNALLGRAVWAVGWPTTRATDGDKGVRSEDGAIREAMRTAGPDLPTVAAITGPMRLTRAGELLTGLAAGMSNGGRLNPDHSRWLMGYPAAWGSCGATAMQSSRKPPRSSSKRR